MTTWPSRVHDAVEVIEPPSPPTLPAVTPVHPGMWLAISAASWPGDVENAGAVGDARSRHWSTQWALLTGWMSSRPRSPARPQLRAGRRRGSWRAHADDGWPVGASGRIVAGTEAQRRRLRR